VNLKKGQFLSPKQMTHVVDKARSTGNGQLLVCERGVSFGYNDLIADMRSLAVLRATGCPVVFDATHAVQRPGAQGSASGGDREHVPLLARAAVAAGVAGVFIETHPRPEAAKSDGATSWPLDLVAPLLEQLKDIDAVVKARPLLEQSIAISADGIRRSAEPTMLREHS
jgi:2-dehydro-3-deoxyphosphooctonate aldolase (KDO 8-P synthase)